MNNNAPKRRNVAPNQQKNKVPQPKRPVKKSPNSPQKNKRPMPKSNGQISKKPKPQMQNRTKAPVPQAKKIPAQNRQVSPKKRPAPNNVNSRIVGNKKPVPNQRNNVRKPAVKKVIRTNSKQRREYLKLKLYLFLILFVLFFGVFAGLFVLSLHSGSSNYGKGYSLQLGADLEEDDTESEDPIVYEIDKESQPDDGAMYVPIDRLADMCSYIISGTQNQIKFSPEKSLGNSIRFDVNSNRAYVNGSRLFMKNKCYMYNGELYVSLDFLTEFSENISYTYDEELNKVTVALEENGVDEETGETIYKNVKFALHNSRALNPIDESLANGSLSDDEDNDDD